jgi:hypothetical protein
MPFLTRFDADHIPGTPNWVLDEDLIWRRPNSEATFCAPKGMETDLYSIPGPLRGLLFRSQSYVEAAVLHDAAYRGLMVGAKLTRREADDLLLEIMAEMGAPRTLRWTIWSGVRVGGWAAFRGSA